jgi:hypothetical protein
LTLPAPALLLLLSGKPAAAAASAAALLRGVDVKLRLNPAACGVRGLPPAAAAAAAVRAVLSGLMAAAGLAGSMMMPRRWKSWM